MKHSMMRSTVMFSVILMLSAVTAACSATEQKPDNTLTDANIAAIVVAANKIDISAAEIALEKSDNPAVLEFANRMIVDHNGVIDAAVELVTRLGVTPVDNDLVASLNNQSAENEANLKQLDGAEFDKAYINHEVAYHEAVIGVINDTLIPGANNAELKDTLIAVVPAFQAHLVHSKQIASEL